MNEQKLQRIREVAVDCPSPVSGKFINYDLGAAARNALPELLAEYDALRQRAEAAEAKLAALTFEPDWSKAPRLAKWWAVDEDGTAHWYWTEPTMGKHGWFVRGSSTHLVGTSQLAGHIELIGRDWWDTLRCKPGSTA